MIQQRITRANTKGWTFREK